MKITVGIRRLFFILMYPILWFLSVVLSFYLLSIHIDFINLCLMFSILFIFRILLLNAFHLFDVSWRFVSVGEVFDLGVALLLSELPSILVMYLVNLALNFRLIIIEFTFSTMFSATLLSLKRVYLTFRSAGGRSKGGRKAILVGDTQRAEKFLRTLEGISSPFFIEGIIATDNARKGNFIRGIKIVGTPYDLTYIVRNRLYDTIYVIGDALRINQLKNLIRECEKSNIRIRVVSIDIAYKNSSIFTVRDVDAEDLLFRGEVTISAEVIEKFINHKRVLITGAAGSIGRELGYQVAMFTPLKLVLLDIDETEVYLLSEKLKKQFPYLDIEYYVADITNEGKINRIFTKEKIDVVFHAAAYKHVPVMERFPDEAVRVNVMGTYIIAKTCAIQGVHSFILISTDKAVEPTSVMGATKRLAEKIVISMARDFPNTSFIVVRFGNVLGSRGSVIPIFNEQIKQGGPVTITHPDMERYFMTTKEAVLLVLEAGSVGKSGDIYVLDMGKPIKIVDLAKELIRLHGLEPDVDIMIKFTGKRPGEKLKEELYSNEERLSKTELEKLLRLKPNGLYNFDYETFISKISGALSNYDEKHLRKLIQESL